MRLSTPELLCVLAIVMLVFGASRVSELGRGLGQGMRSFRDALRGEQDKPTDASDTNKTHAPRDNNGSTNA